MAEDTVKKIPGGPSRLSGRGAAFKAARERYKKSGGTDPYAKDAQFEYGGKKYNVAMAGEKRGAATGTKRASSPGPEQPLAKVSSPEYRAGSSKARPADMKPDKKPVNRMSAQQYMDKTAGDSKKDNYGEFSRAPLRFDADAGLDAAGLAAMAYPPARAGLTALRGSRMAAAASGMGKRAMDAAPGMGKRAMDAAKNMFSRKKPDAGTGKVVSAEETIARVKAKAPDVRPLLPKQVAAARKAADSDLAATKARVQKANSARLNDEVTSAEAKDLREGYKKGGKVKAKKNALPSFLLNRFKKGAKPGDKAKAPMKFKEGGMVKGIDGCAQRGRTRA